MTEQDSSRCCALEHSTIPPYAHHPRCCHSSSGIYTLSRFSRKVLGLGEGDRLTLCGIELQSTIESESRKMTFSPSRCVTGLLGFKPRKYVIPFIFISITSPVHAMTLGKWTKELDWPKQGTDATTWVHSETISSSMRWVEHIRVL